MQRLGLFLLCFSLSAAPLAAQDACLSLLRHGVYDKFREQQLALPASQVRTELCQVYGKFLQDRAAKRPEAQYTLSSGLGTFSRSQLEAVGRLMCLNSYTASLAVSELVAMQDKISHVSLEAFKECLKTAAAGLRTETVFREDDQGHLTLEMSYVAPPNAPETTALRAIAVSPPTAFRCTGPLWELQSKGGQLDAKKYAMSCERDIKTAPFTHNGRSVYAPASTLAVMTDIGTTTRSLAAIPAGPAAPPAATPAPAQSSPPVLPVGTLIAFAGTMAEAEAQKSAGWWVCDGRTVDDPQASHYHRRPTPNLVDKFLLGAKSAGETGGAKSAKIGDQVIESIATGWANALVYKDPRLLVIGNQPQQAGAPITSQGVVKGFDVATLPPFYTVLYLIKVK